MRFSRTALTGVVGLGLAAGMAAVPVASASAAPVQQDSSVSAYAGSKAEAKNNQAFFEAIRKIAIEKQAEKPGIQAVTIGYDASGAPTFADQIASSTQIWNSSVENVQLQEGGSDFEYREGDDPRGSYASTDGHGSGYIFLDYAQNEEYDSTRVTAHETGHVLGLPDHYEGPCEELMSGGGPGPSCTNSQPNAEESAQVNELWANGLTDQIGLNAAFVK
ncbi:snapalysin [Streptomyces sp. Z26]|uniref:snapalysin n=1 Tax=Streptomyces TaxID=1883 RepID=UPI000EF13D99|nr:snapalysin [Streptomyces sp. Z26]RLL68844.1 snapalysin [Streptomyces sp. Z26]